VSWYTLRNCEWEDLSLTVVPIASTDQNCSRSGVSASGTVEESCRRTDDDDSRNGEGTGPDSR